jgi:hypothetical protein
VTFDAIWAVTAPASGHGPPELGAGGWLWIIVILGLTCLPLLTIFAALWAGGPDVPAGDAVPIVTTVLMCALSFTVLDGSWDRQLRLDALTAAQLGDAYNGLAAYLVLAAVTLVAAVIRLAVDATVACVRQWVAVRRSSS